MDGPVMTATDERTLQRLHSDQLRQGDCIMQIYTGEFGTNSRYFTVKRLVERVSGYYLVQDGTSSRALYWDGDLWREAADGPAVEIDDETTSNRWLGS